MISNKTKRKRTWRDEADRERIQKNTVKIFSRIFKFLMAAAIGAGVIYVLFFCPLARVKEVNISGAKADAESQIREKIKEFLNKKKLLVFPNDSVVLFNKDLLKAEIIKISAIKNAFVEWKIPNSLNILIEERAGVMNWCQADKCFIVDKEGAEAAASLDEGFAIVNSECRSENPHPEKIIFIKSVFEHLSKIGLKPVSFYLESCFTRKLTAQVSMFKIYFDLSRPLEDQITILQKIIADKSRVILEYIDLQVEGRVYYK